MEIIFLIFYTCFIIRTKWAIEEGPGYKVSKWRHDKKVVINLILSYLFCFAFLAWPHPDLSVDLITLSISILLAIIITTSLLWIFSFASSGSKKNTTTKRKGMTKQKGISLVLKDKKVLTILIVGVFGILAFTACNNKPKESSESAVVEGTLFRVGDKIIMNSKANEYNWSKEGSIGVIQKIHGQEATVLFSKLTGGHDVPTSYPVRLDCMDSLEPKKDDMTEVYPGVFDNGQNIGWINQPYWTKAFPLLQRWINDHPYKRVVSFSSDSAASYGNQTGWAFVYEDKVDLPYRTSK